MIGYIILLFHILGLISCLHALMSTRTSQSTIAQGVALSFSRMFADTWEPFFRTGYSEDGGALWERQVSAGFGFYPGKKDNVLGVGLNWNRPAEDVFGPVLDDQYTAEIYYRFQVLKVLSITPDVQIIIDPALNPDESLIWVFGLRARLAL